MDKIPNIPPYLLHNLQDIIQSFSDSIEINETLSVTLKRLMEHMQTEAASVFLLNDDGSKLICQACAGPVDLTGMVVEVGEGIIGKTVAEESIQLIRDTSLSASFSDAIDKQTQFKTRSILCAPLTVQRKTIGAIELINKIPSAKQPNMLFDHIDKQLLSILAASAALAIHNAWMVKELVHSEKLQQELDIARTIQESFLPTFEDRHPIIGLNLAAQKVSGDFYDYIPLDNGSYAFNIGDVSGKGIEAALLMAKGSSLFHCLAKTISSPAEILRIINEELSEKTTRGMFITMIAGIYNPSNKEISLANAGHLPAIQHSLSGKFTYHESRSLPLGILGDQVFEETHFSLAKSSLYLYTDGLSEGLSRALNKPDELSNMQDLINRFNNEPRQQRLKLFADEVSLTEANFDDLTILLIEDSK